MGCCSSSGAEKTRVLALVRHARQGQAEGGTAPVFGRKAGGLLLGVVEALGMHFSSPSLKMLLSYAVFIGVLIWRPNGLFSKK